MAEKDTLDRYSELTTDQPPSCIELCPADPSIFVIGTYKLEDSQFQGSVGGSDEATPQSRSGRIEVYKISDKSFSSSDLDVEKQCMNKYDLPHCSVLDLHFHPHHPTLFAICTSTSEMIFFSLDRIGDASTRNKPEVNIRRVGSYRLRDDKKVLATSFAWEPHSTPCWPAHFSFAVTLSSGEVELLTLRRSDGRGSDEIALELLNRVQIDPAHSLEAWTVACLYLDEDKTLVFTGGDDSTLTLNLVTKPAEANDTWSQRQLCRDRRSHTAGVTAILPIFQSAIPKTTVFLTGSYDEYIRIFTVQSDATYRPELVAELRLDGGVWRLKTMSQPVRENLGGSLVHSVLVLGSCMHAGMRILRISFTQQDKDSGPTTPSEWKIEVLGSFTKGHDSMCYGADSIPSSRLRNARIRVEDDQEADSHGSLSQSPPCPQSHPHLDFVVVSTSFYDRKVCIWEFYTR